MRSGKTEKPEFRLIIADVTNREKMDNVFRDYRPEIVFHAAAYKHVGLMEENPHESIHTNVGGTRIMTKLAVKYKVGKFVMISTDKSVNPMSVMELPNVYAKKIIQAESQKEGCKTQFIVLVLEMFGIKWFSCSPVQQTDRKTEVQ